MQIATFNMLITALKNVSIVVHRATVNVFLFITQMNVKILLHKTMFNILMHARAHTHTHTHTHTCRQGNHNDKIRLRHTQCILLLFLCDSSNEIQAEGSKIALKFTAA